MSNVISDPMIDPPPPIGIGLTLTMAVACGIAVANVYYNQPMLSIIERDFPGTDLPGMIPTATQIGYAVGLFLLVPMGDFVDRRRLIVVQFLVLGLALVAAATSPNAGVLLASSVLVGVSATVAQQIIPFAASLAPPERRGRVVGTVMSGLLCGILLSRTLAGFVASHFGWRITFWVALPLALVTAGMMAGVLPRHVDRGKMKYYRTLRSLFQLWADEPGLRLATATQAALFASFTAFWTTLAFHLEQPAFRLGADVAGLFGIIGAVGIFAAPLAGRLADSRGPKLVILIGASVALSSWIILGLWGAIAGLIVGVIVLDFGVQSALVSNQHVIYALRPDARSRLNTLFVTGMYIGGAIGSAGAAAAWKFGGWSAVSVYGGGLAGAALLFEVLARRSRSQQIVGLSS